MSEAERIDAFKQWYEQCLQEGMAQFGCTVVPVLQTEPLSDHRALVGAALTVVVLPKWTPPPKE